MGGRSEGSSIGFKCKQRAISNLMRAFSSLVTTRIIETRPPLARWRESDRLGERQESRFENLKVFEFDPMLLGGSAPKPPGFFEA